MGPLETNKVYTAVFDLPSEREPQSDWDVMNFLPYYIPVMGKPEKYEALMTEVGYDRENRVIIINYKYVEKK
jgi:hypothetical protein